MSGREKRYWKSLEPTHQPPPAGGEEVASSVSLSRRGFLRTAGFAVPAATLIGCSRAPVEEAIPFLLQPETVLPGKSMWYASTCFACEAACGVLVKNRDGRPIKLEGNPQHPLSRGGLCARGQAAVLELYDEQRLDSPLSDGEPSTWEQVDAEVAGRLEKIRESEGTLRVLTGTVVSPTIERMIALFLRRFPGSRHVAYDAVSHSAILDAHEATHGARVLPHYRLERADVLVGLDADFLGTWISPVEYTAGWRSGRRPTSDHPVLSYHLQVESRLSITGSKADRRWAVRPGDIPLVATRLAAAVARRAAESGIESAADDGAVPQEEIEALADRLWEARGRGLVVCGSDDLNVQLLCNRVNRMIGAYGATVDLAYPSRQASGNDRVLSGLLEELRQGKVAALLVAGVNPAYELAAVPEIAELLRSVPLLVSFARWNDETSRLAHFVCPDHHPLESWGDAEPVAGVFSTAQPAIAPLGRTRSLIETLAVWSGAPASARDLVRDTWRRSIHPHVPGAADFEAFWDAALERGFVEARVAPTSLRPLPAGPAPRPPASAPDGMELVLYPSLAMNDGRHALNPWLHELPDPITKVTWDNCAALSPADATRLGVAPGDIVRVEAPSANGRAAAVELPVFVQPGQATGTVAVALGYGRAGSERFAAIGPEWIGAPARSGDPSPVGTDVSPFVVVASSGRRSYSRAGMTVSFTGRRRPLACTQTHHTLEVPAKLAIPGVEKREVVRELSLSALAAGEREEVGGEEHQHATMWPEDHPYTGHHWGLVVDLSACTGCSACVVGCQAENNIPVVGRDEVRRRREMHWLRIDTYYSGDGSEVEVAHQPMMCQQCDNAPCETVCPVLATVHSEEGLSEQVYNRCVGTRYCANNCPYKVRRFNWFNYHKQGGREDLVLNPDVTARSRGVMEKCSFCSQRILAAKIEAKQQGVPLADGAVRVACEQSCPAGAIVFGDLNDPNSRVARLMNSPHRYGVLEELGVRPSVGYLAVVRHGGDGEGGHHG